MKKTLIPIILASLLLLTLGSSTIAVEGTTDDAIETSKKREFLQGGVEEAKIKIQEKRQEIRQHHQIVRAKIAQHHARRLEKRFGAYHQRFTAIIGKMAKRFEMMEDKGKNMDDAQVKLSEAEILLTAAKMSADQALSTFNDVDANDDYETQSELALAASDLTQDARTDFKAVLVLLKGAVKQAKQINY